MKHTGSEVVEVHILHIIIIYSNTCHQGMFYIFEIFWKTIIVQNRFDVKFKRNLYLRNQFPSL